MGTGQCWNLGLAKGNKWWVREFRRKTLFTEKTIQGLVLSMSRQVLTDPLEEMSNRQLEIKYIFCMFNNIFPKIYIDFKCLNKLMKHLSRIF